MSFDGRSVSLGLPQYTLREKIIIKFSTHLMPLITSFVLSNRLNTIIWKLLGCKVGHKSVIRTGTQINAPFLIVIGKNCNIHGILKSRGRINIGNGVELVEEVYISTQSHNVDSSNFESVYTPVTIADYAWLGPRSIILSGITINTGSVVAAGAVVTKDTEPWKVFGGVPAKLIKSRKVLRPEEVMCD